MTTNLDLGARCDEHAGEAFQVRCAACDQANRELEQQQADERHQRAIQRNLALGISPHSKPQPIRRLPYRQRR
ncbi:hypothetical protein [Leifsonia sp. 1010]|uniref:hypothetical protein n=1 Tax=Leifsonia sp. 1010 TaxID=2817769 RepID=UPI002854C35C|nr:hypothetical protein [Leifsonia sp. 1010]MDR6613592.1 hypothetical protein [Leifsonia sp. 1010]